MRVARAKPYFGVTLEYQAGRAAAQGYSAGSRADSARPTPSAATNSPNEFPERVAADAWAHAGGPIAGPLAHAGASRRTPSRAAASPRRLPPRAPDRRAALRRAVDTNAGHSEQCVRLTGAAWIGHGSPTHRWRTATPHGAVRPVTGGPRSAGVCQRAGTPRHKSNDVWRSEIEGIAGGPLILPEGPATGRRVGSTVLRELVERATTGDQEAFASLVQVTSGRLYAVAYRTLRDPYLAEDALQQTLISIWNELPRLRDPDRFEAWSYRVIVRASTAEAKRGKRAGSTCGCSPTMRWAVGPDQFGAVAERDRLDRAFKRLKADQRAVLVLQHYLGLTPVEMAEVLGIPVGTVGSRLHYATRALRAALEADERTTSSEERSA